MKCLTNCSDSASSNRAAVSRVVFAKDTRFDQTGDAGGTPNFNDGYEARRECRALHVAIFHSVDAEPSVRKSSARLGPSWRQQSEEGLRSSLQHFVAPRMMSFVTESDGRW